MTQENTDLAFLPYLLDEDIYLIDVSEEMATLISPPVDSIATEATPIIQEKQPSIAPEKPVEEPKPVAMVQEPTQENIKKRKKVVIMVGYQGVDIVPTQVHEALTKIFEALKLRFEDVEIINVLSPKAPKVEDFVFEYLVLMGGNGKNLTLLQNYTGTRNRYDIATHNNVSIFFAESMDVYFKNIELKKKFWAKLKELFIV